MQRLGVRDNDAGRELLTKHFEETVNDPSNVSRAWTSEHGAFETRESLFNDPSGKFAKFETTWEVLPNGTRRLTTVIPKGGGRSNAK